MSKLGNIVLLAFRNVLRNRRRSLLSAGVLVMGVVSLLLFGSYIEGVYYFLGNSVIAQHGHFQISLRGYRDGEAESLVKALSQKDQKVIAEMIRRKGGVKIMTPRITTSGIIGNQERSTIFLGYGVNPEKELDLLSQVGMKGANLAVLLDKNTILVGKILAKQLGLSVGSMVTLLSMSEAGSLEAVYVTVGDVISTGVTAIDSRLVLGNVEMMQELLYTSKVQSIVVLLDEGFSREGVEKYAKELSNMIEAQGLPYEVRLWYELDDTYLPTIRMFRTIFTIVTVIFLVVIGFTIVNTMYMAVMERVSEVGTLRAMGTSPAMVFGLFVAEGTVISVVAGCVGLVIGALLIRFFNELAISLPPYPGQSESYPLTFLFSAKIFLWAFGFNVMGGMVASMIPARKAVSFSIVEALRHV